MHACVYIVLFAPEECYDKVFTEPFSYWDGVFLFKNCIAKFLKTSRFIPVK